MAHPTPRADALRQMREAKFEAEQKRLRQETSKPAEVAKRKPEARAADVNEDKPVAPNKPAAKVAKTATDTTDTPGTAPAAKSNVKKAVTKAVTKVAPKKAAAKAAKKVKASAK